jgi:hypothetical protein
MRFFTDESEEPAGFSRPAFATAFTRWWMACSAPEPGFSRLLHTLHKARLKPANKRLKFASHHRLQAGGKHRSAEADPWTLHARGNPRQTLNPPFAVRYSAFMPDDQALPPAPPTSPALDDDAYCPNCGYNQRGLPGSPIRCPECGDSHLRSELRRPKLPRVISPLEREKRGLKAAADLCAVAVLPGLLGVLTLLLAEYDTRPVAVPVTIASGVIWLGGVALFAWRCRGLPGWGLALAKYHIAGSVAMAVNLLLVAVGWGLLGAGCTSVAGSMLDEIDHALGGSTLGIAVVIGLVATMCLLPGPLVAALVVRFDPMGWLKRIGAGPLDELARESVDRSRKADERRHPPTLQARNGPSS